MTDNLDYLELLNNSFVAFHTYSLDMKQIYLLHYELNPLFEYSDKDQIIENIKKFSPNYTDNDEFKEKYKKLIKTITCPFAIFLIFDDNEYFSLLGIDSKKAYKITGNRVLDFLYPFKLKLEFKMINQNDEASYHNINITFGAFFYNGLDVQNDESETLRLVPEGGKRYLGEKEIKFKI